MKVLAVCQKLIADFTIFAGRREVVETADRGKLDLVNL
jgi:hypothetical protein